MISPILTAAAFAVFVVNASVTPVRAAERVIDTYSDDNHSDRPSAPSISTSSDDNSGVRVKVEFYGESRCPFCRKFVTEAWPKVWLDAEGLRSHVDYDMVAWGNAYFATKECGQGPYSSDERACWYKQCMSKVDKIITDDETIINDDCFAGNAVYQHGEKEGTVDIYETCIKVDYSLEYAVDFTFCAEGSIMDNDDITAEKLLTICTISMPNVDAKAVQKCFEERGKELEIGNAKQTPAHPGVPYVLLDGTPVEDPMNIQDAICKALKDKGMDKLPESCASGTAVQPGMLRTKARN
jgi:Gamma interferon inducible lysosomal thiol reductase (GILT)